MPSGNSSIPFLLEAFGHLLDGIERRLRLKLLGDDRRLETLRGDVQVIVDDDVVVELFSGVNLVEGLGHPPVDFFSRIQAPAFEPSFELRDRRGKNKDAQRTLFKPGIVGDLPGTLVVNVEDDVLAALEPCQYLQFGGAVSL